MGSQHLLQELRQWKPHNDHSCTISTPTAPQPGPRACSPLWKSLAKTSLKQGQRRKHAQKILIHQGSESGEVSKTRWQLSGRVRTRAHMGVQRTLLSSEMLRVGQLDFYPVSTNRSRLLSISAMPLEKSEEIHHGL